MKKLKPKNIELIIKDTDGTVLTYKLDSVDLSESFDYFVNISGKRTMVSYESRPFRIKKLFKKAVRIDKEAANPLVEKK